MAHTYTCIYTPDTGARIYIRKIFNKSFYIYLKNTLLCLKYLLNKDFKKEYEIGQIFESFENNQTPYRSQRSLRYGKSADKRPSR